MASPYREAAFVERDEKRDMLRYVIAKCDETTKGEWWCPLCLKNIEVLPDRLVRICNPFRRYPVAGLLWWTKYCPLPGVHWHVNCPCGAHVVSRDDHAVDVREASFPKEKP